MFSLQGESGTPLRRPIGLVYGVTRERTAHTRSLTISNALVLAQNLLDAEAGEGAQDDSRRPLGRR